MIQQGVSDAKVALDNKKVTIQDHIHFFTLKQGNDKRVHEKSFEEFLELKSQGLIEATYDKVALEKAFLQLWKHMVSKKYLNQLNINNNDSILIVILISLI